MTNESSLSLRALRVDEHAQRQKRQARQRRKDLIWSTQSNLNKYRFKFSKKCTKVLELIYFEPSSIRRCRLNIVLPVRDCVRAKNKRRVRWCHCWPCACVRGKNFWWRPAFSLCFFFRDTSVIFYDILWNFTFDGEPGKRTTHHKEEDNILSLNYQSCSKNARQSQI